MPFSNEEIKLKFVHFRGFVSFFSLLQWIWRICALLLLSWELETENGEDAWPGDRICSLFISNAPSLTLSLGGGTYSPTSFSPIITAPLARLNYICLRTYMVIRSLLVNSGDLGILHCEP